MQCPTFNLLIVMLNEHTGGLKSMNGLLTFLIKASEDHLYNDNGEDLFPNVCKEAVNTGGFSLALICKLSNNSGNIELTAFSSKDYSFDENQLIVKQFAHLVKNKIKKGEYFIDNNFNNHKIKSKINCQSLAGFPIKENEKILWSLILATDQENYFDEEKILLLKKFTIDVSFALKQIETGTTAEYLSAILESSDDAIISKDLNGIITGWNHGAQMIFGYSSKEMVGKSLHILVPPDRLNEEEFILNSIKEGKKVSHLKTLRLHKNGKVLNISLSVSPIRNKEGEIVGASHTARDMTKQIETDEQLITNKVDLERINIALSKSEGQLANIINSAMDAIITIDSKQKIVLFNNAAEKIFRCSSDDAIGNTLDKFVPAKFREIHRLHVENFSKTSTTQRIMGNINPVAGVRTNGEEFPIEASISQVASNGDIFFTVILKDITERKRAEEQLIKSKNELELSNKNLVERTKELEAFSYSVSHDLRAPLRAISGYAKMFEEDYSNKIDKEGNRLLNIIQNSAKTMDLLINDLLALSRFGRQVIRKSEVDMAKLVESVLQEINKTVKHKAKVIVNNLKPVMADYSLMIHVVTNLLSNAIKYSSKVENPVIDVRSKIDDGEIIYSIKDNGAGFDMKYVDKLFGVFQRLHSEKEFEGTGVGLAIVSLIIKKHNGKVWADGKVNDGATFYFSLPN